MKISVITATYNSAATIGDTLASILSQTHGDVESIVVDGGSTDATLDIVRRYEARFGGRLRWVSEPDRGIYDAMNKGIGMATGDVVGLLNSDDFYTCDDVLATVAAAFGNSSCGNNDSVGNNDSGNSCGNNDSGNVKSGNGRDDSRTPLDAVYGDIHFVRPSDLGRCVRYYSSRLFRPWLMRFGYMPAHPSFYARREIYERYGLYSLDYKIAADFEMLVRLFCRHHIRARYLKKDFVTMRTGGMSTRSWRHRILGTREDARACRANGIRSCFAMCSVKYLTKMFEFR